MTYKFQQMGWIGLLKDKVQQEYLQLLHLKIQIYVDIAYLRYWEKE